MCSIYPKPYWGSRGHLGTKQVQQTLSLSLCVSLHLNVGRPTEIVFLPSILTLSACAWYASFRRRTSPKHKINNKDYESHIFKDRLCEANGYKNAAVCLTGCVELACFGCHSQCDESEVSVKAIKTWWIKYRIGVGGLKAQILGNLRINLWIRTERFAPSKWWFNTY